MPKKLESTETTDQQTKSERSTEVANPQLTQTGPSPEVLKVLREEADRETRARKEEARATSDNSGSDGQRVELDPGTLTPALQKGEASTSQHGGSVRATALPKTKRRGELLISCLVILAALMTVLVYSHAPQIADAIPQAEPHLITFVESANKLRTLINDLIEAIVNSGTHIPAATP